MKTIKSLLVVSVLAATGTANATVWNVAMSANDIVPLLGNNDLIMKFVGTYDDATGTGSWTGTADIVGITGAHYDQTFEMSSATGIGNLDALNQATCTDIANGTGCTDFTIGMQGDYFNTVGITTTEYQTPVGFIPVNGGVFTWTYQMNISYNDSNGNRIYEYSPVPTQVMLTAVSDVPVPTSAWLFGSALTGLLGLKHKRKSI